MYQILIGVTLAALLVAGLQSWRADEAVENAARWGKSVEQLSSALERQSRSIADQKGRFEDFDTSMLQLQGQQAEATAVLLKRLTDLKNFIPQPGDSDETIRCAGLPVPLDVDRRLRE